MTVILSPLAGTVEVLDARRLADVAPATTLRSGRPIHPGPGRQPDGVPHQRSDLPTAGERAPPLVRRNPMPPSHRRFRRV